MKKFILPSLLLASFTSFAQNNTGIPIPMKNGIVFYEKEYTVPKASTEELYDKAYNWFTKTFGSAENKIKISDRKNGKLVAEGAFKIVVNENGNYYWLKPVIDIKTNNSGYTFEAYSFYEKPVEKGITNDYSKIEYRWWDFRKGKPWSSEDKKLFEGLDQNTISLMTSLEQDMLQ